MRLYSQRSFITVLATSGILIASLLGTGCATRESAPAARANPPVHSSSGIKYGEQRQTPREKPDPVHELHPRGIDFSHAPETIAFGSCANQDAPQPIWNAILKEEPDLFLAMGDNVYADHPGQEDIAEQYRKLNRIPEYRKARETIPFMATWDDGDFGTNDGGGSAPTRAQARKEFLNYFRYVQDSIPMGREGIYHSKLIGGQVTGKRRKRVQGPTMQVIMLDTRTFRSPLKRNEDPNADPLKKYLPDTDKSKTILGEAQWDWLEDQLRKPAQLRIIVSSIQVIASEHGFEKWANFPHEQQRFFDLLRKTKAHNVIVLSGDRHMGSIAKKSIKDWGTLYDITSSSLNRPSNLHENDKDYVAEAYPQENFGVLKIDWKKKRVQAQLKDIDGKNVQEVAIPFR